MTGVPPCGREVQPMDWAALAEPILATRAWRPAQAAPGAGDGEHEHGWAGRGFNRPGPEPESEHQAEAGVIRQ